MEIRNLRTFREVAERGSFTAAAAALDYSQSTVSFQIRQLEEELGCLLFERMHHAITLTEQGRQLLSYAHSVLRLTEEFRQNMEAGGEPEGSVHIVAPDSVCEALLLSHYVEFSRRYPKISLKFSSGDTGDMFRMLDRNEVDVMLTLDRHVYGRDYIIAGELPVGMHFVTRVGSPLLQRGPLRLEDLVEEAFLLTETGMSYRGLLDKAWAEKSLEVRPVLEIGRTDILLRVLGQGGISFLPDFVTASAVERGELAYLPVENVEIPVWKQLIYHRNKWISHSLRAFLDFIIEKEFTL
jgi:DNA-binding transcriptional LysR family regulator